MSSNSHSSLSKQPMFFGWKVALALLVILTFTSGLSFYNHAVFLDAFAKEGLFNLEDASLAVTIFFLSSGFAGLWIGKVIDRVDPRVLISIGAALSCLALIGVRYSDALWQLYLSYSLFGAGFSAAGLLPATTLITRWFVRRRAVALSVASTGLSLGGILVTPPCAALVEAWGLRAATPVFGLVFLIGIIPTAWLWLRPYPADMNLLPDGDKPINEKPVTLETTLNTSSTKIANGISYSDAKHQRFFWGVSLSFILLMLAQVGGIAHQYGLAKQLLSETQTALAVAILPTASIIGRLAGGWLIGLMSLRVFALNIMFLQVFALTLLATDYAPFTLCLGLACFGITVGNLLMLQPLLIAEAFGPRDYAKIFSFASLLSSWGTAAGPMVLGLAFSFSGSYGGAYWLAALAGLIGLIIFIWGGPLRRAN
ncbi:MFS transporter [Aurantivibrio plasticivorans]